MKLAFGTGTGRCGTKSLRVLCMAQPRCFVTHERLHLPWVGGEAVLQEALAVWRRAEKGGKRVEAPWEAGAEVRGAWDGGEKIVGDIGPWYLPLVPVLVELHGATVVHLERDRASYLESALRGPWDCMSAHPAPGEEPGEDFQDTIPKFLASREEAAGLYWDMVHKMAQDLTVRYPCAFRVWSMWDLDSKAKQLEMMRHIGVSEPVALDCFPDRAENRLALVGP